MTIAENKFMQKSTPNIGFVSLGCPKNLVDSERILTELRTDGYNIVPSYENVDLVIVNTCGFIDSAVQESLEAIGEALEENGRVKMCIRDSYCCLKYEIEYRLYPLHEP